MNIIVPNDPDVHIHSILDDLDVRKGYMDLVRFEREYNTYCICKIAEDIEDEVRNGFRNIETRKRVQQALQQIFGKFLKLFPKRR